MATRTIKLAAALALAGLSGSTAIAQITGVFDMGALTNTLSTDVLRQSEEARAARGSLGSAIRTSPRSSLQGGQAISPAQLTYRYSPAVRRQNQQRFVSKLATVDKQGAADLQRAFTQKNVMSQIERAMRAQGLNPASVADTTALYMVTAWYGVRGSTDSTTADFKAVSRQLAGSMPGNAVFAQASDAVKQEVAESMMVQAVLAEQAVTAAQKQPSAMPRVKSAIGQGARAAFGFDIGSKKLGAQGLQ